MSRRLTQRHSIKAVTFDLEGPCITLEEQHFLAFVHAVKKLTAIETSMTEIVSEIPNAIGGGDEVIAYGLEHLIDDEVKAIDILTEKQKVFWDLVLESDISLRPGLINVLTWLKQNNYNLAIGSLTPGDSARKLIKDTRLTDFIEPHKMLFLEDVKNKKPSPEVYIQTAKLSNAHPSEQLVFEDSPTGMRSAKSAGSIVIATPVVSIPKTLMEIVSENPFRIIHDWREINIEAIITNIAHI